MAGRTRVGPVAWAVVALAALTGPADPCRGAEPQAPADARRGAAPGDERGPGRFVARKDRTFYAAAGGRLWYYLNLYYWAPKDLETEDLWVRAQVVATFRDLKRWPDSSAAEAPAPKVTVEYWKVGQTGRSVVIDNHKDFWLVDDDLCAGEIGVEMTLRLGRVRVRDARGTFAKPTRGYVLDRRSYERKAGLGAENISFTPLPGEPENVWRYGIPWSACPGRFVRSNWEELRVPELTLERSAVPPSAPVLTGR